MPPSSTAGYGDQPLDVVVVTNGGGTSKKDAALTIVKDDPRVTSAQPSPAQAGTDVTVVGVNLFDAKDLNYDGSTKDDTKSRPIFLVDTGTGEMRQPRST